MNYSLAKIKCKNLQDPIIEFRDKMQEIPIKYQKSLVFYFFGSIFTLLN